MVCSLTPRRKRTSIQDIIGIDYIYFIMNNKLLLIGGGAVIVALALFFFIRGGSGAVDNSEQGAGDNQTEETQQEQKNADIVSQTTSTATVQQPSSLKAAFNSGQSYKCDLNHSVGSSFSATYYFKQDKMRYEVSFNGSEQVYILNGSRLYTKSSSGAETIQELGQSPLTNASIEALLDAAGGVLNCTAQNVSDGLFEF